MSKTALVLLVAGTATVRAEPATTSDLCSASVDASLEWGRSIGGPGSVEHELTATSLGALFCVSERWQLHLLFDIRAATVAPGMPPTDQVFIGGAVGIRFGPLARLRRVVGEGARPKYFDPAALFFELGTGAGLHTDRELGAVISEHSYGTEELDGHIVWLPLETDSYAVGFALRAGVARLSGSYEKMLFLGLSINFR